MFARYAVTFGRGAHRHRLRTRAEALGLPICIDLPDLLFVAEAGTPFLMLERSIVVGELFSADDQPVRELTEGRFDAECTLDGSRNRRWGNFALFDGASTSVYRDPSGTIPVYDCAHSGEDVFVSDADLALRLELLGTNSPDLTFVVHWLQYPFLRAWRTGIDNVVEVLPGVRRRRDRAAWRDEALWRPVDFIGRSEAITHPIEAAQVLKSRALSAIAAQCRGKSVLLQLSGGLDSSIIASCLHAAGVDVKAINFATRSTDGDERRFARDVAERFNLPLMELAEVEAPAVEDGLEPMFRPPANPLLRSYQSALETAARQSERLVLVDGGGGDNLFCYVTSAAPVIDALWWRGLGPAMKTIHDIASRANCTWWQAAGGAVKRLFGPTHAWNEDWRFLNRDALLRCCEGHPWLDGLERALPGKREHVRALVEVQHFLDRGCSPSIGRLHPLLGQPLLETCLRVPSWTWLRGGRDRAVARDAFEHLLPASVIRRRTKGSLQSLLHRTFLRMREEIHETLLGGELRRCGILNAAAVESELAGSDVPGDEVQLRLTEMVALEKWLNDWRSRAAAAGRCA